MEKGGKKIKGNKIDLLTVFYACFVSNFLHHLLVRHHVHVVLTIYQFIEERSLVRKILFVLHIDRHRILYAVEVVRITVLSDMLIRWALHLNASTWIGDVAHEREESEYATIAFDWSAFVSYQPLVATEYDSDGYAVALGFVLGEGVHREDG